MINKVRLFVKLSYKMKMLFIRSYILTGYYRFLILFRPFKKLASKIGEEGYETDHNKPTTVALQYMKDVRKTVYMSSNNTLWQSKCLVQALTAQTLLKKRRIASTVYLGLLKDQEEGLLAHAWLRVGPYYVTGDSGMSRFTAVAWFGYDPEKINVNAD